MSYILTLDQGTTASRSLIVNAKGEVVAMAQQEFTQHFPRQGWVEHDPDEIWSTQRDTMQQVIRESGIHPSEIKAIGITNQRETTVAWNRTTGKAIGNAIVWQDKRTAPMCEQLKLRGLGEYVRTTTGLVIDAYFSATKMHYILRNYPEAEKLLRTNELCFGTVDSWLMYKLTENRVHATDTTNASRTMLFDIRNLKWDDRLLNELDIHPSTLPEVKSSIGFFGNARIDGANVPIMGVAGDQQAALFGQLCFEAGMVKNTYGTGCFMLMNTGRELRESHHGLLTTVAWSDAHSTTYALEGSVFIAGAAIQWLRDGLKIIDHATDSEYFARKAQNEEPVYVVPAFSGLGAPYWDMYARGAVFGLTRDTGKDELIRATLESMAYQTRDVIEAMAVDAGTGIHSLRVDGGASANDYLMQFQADIIEREVIRPANVESTAMGAAYLAGMAAGVWTRADLLRIHANATTFRPKMEGKTVSKLYHGWKKAVQRSMHWLDDEP
ncbi:MAG: glycerol kinase GlpK [Flavobacteriales bacterium]